MSNRSDASLLENYARGREPITVSELNRAAGGVLERAFPLVAVKGEISNLSRASSGHWYFVLKDSAAQVRCAMFRGRAQYVGFIPRDGDAVELSAQVRLYEARGEFQLVVDSLKRAGAGDLLEAFNRLKQKLSEEGLFDESRKRPLPTFVRAVGIVTSPDAAALRDVARALAEHAPHVRAIVYPALVQGESAPTRIVEAIELANSRAEVDVLIVCRGGGSLEDLQAFNDERVARAIAASALVTIVGVGHESDITIADFVADVRAPTPTAAGRTASIAREVWIDRLDDRSRSLKRCAERAWERATLRLDAASGRLVSPHQHVDAIARSVGQLEQRLRAAVQAQVRQASARVDLRGARLATKRPDVVRAQAAVDRLAVRMTASTTAAWRDRQANIARLGDVLRAVSPQATLARGYAIVTSTNGFITRSAQLHPGESATIRFEDGNADVSVDNVSSNRG